MKPIDIDFIFPGIFRILPAPGIVENGFPVCVVDGNKHIFHFIDNDSYPDGTIISILINSGFLFCESIDDAQIRLVKQDRERCDREIRNQQIEEKKDAAIKAFNDSLKIPFKWKAEINRVLSGLSENSAGNGCSKSTVFHIVLLEDYEDDQIFRKKGQFLCKSKGSFSEMIDLDDCENDGQNYKITCKMCLKLTRRWAKGESNE